MNVRIGFPLASLEPGSFCVWQGVVTLLVTLDVGVARLKFFLSISFRRSASLKRVWAQETCDLFLSTDLPSIFHALSRAQITPCI